MPRSLEAGPDLPGIAWSEDSQVIGDIRAARVAGADLVIPFMHWGWEREPNPSERQRQLAHSMFDAGADVVAVSYTHLAFAMLVGALSFLPVGLGSSEAVMFGQLVLNGVTAVTAVTATLLCRLATLWFAAACGAACPP